MTDPVLEGDNLPGLYQSANQASLSSQSVYFWGLGLYLVLLVIAAFVSFSWPVGWQGAVGSAALFLMTLGILIFLRVKRPDDLWYNGRAVAESVKTRAWRWVMRAEPYEDTAQIEIVSRQFISDLKAILNQNRTLSGVLDASVSLNGPISTAMRTVRGWPIEKRLEIYKKQRIDDQALWYSRKSQFNKRKARQWFWVSVVLHSITIALLLYRIKDPCINLPVGVIATTASAVLTWLQSKKHNELNSSYALTAHEIVLIKGDALSVKNEDELSQFVLSSETAFSREHTQWAARKAD